MVVVRVGEVDRLLGLLGSFGFCLFRGLVGFGLGRRCSRWLGRSSARVIRLFWVCLFRGLVSVFLDYRGRSSGVLVLRAVWRNPGYYFAWNSRV